MDEKPQRRPASYGLVMPGSSVRAYMGDHYYAMKLRSHLKYSRAAFKTSPDIFGYIPASKVRRTEICSLKDEFSGDIVIKECDCFDAAAIKFLIAAEGLGPGDAVMTPTGCIMAIVPADDWRRELEAREGKHRKPSLSRIPGNDGVAVAEWRVSDEDVFEWTSLYYPEEP